MSKAQDIARLLQLADLSLDNQLVALRAAAQAKAESQAQLVGLDQPASAESPSDIASGIVALNYQRWADARRTELNLVLARQTAAWLNACDAARLSFARKAALQSLSDKLAADRAMVARR